MTNQSFVKFLQQKRPEEYKRLFDEYEAQKDRCPICLGDRSLIYHGNHVVVCRSCCKNYPERQFHIDDCSVCRQPVVYDDMLKQLLQIAFCRGGKYKCIRVKLISGEELIYAPVKDTTAFNIYKAIAYYGNGGFLTCGDSESRKKKTYEFSVGHTIDLNYNGKKNIGTITEVF